MTIKGFNPVDVWNLQNVDTDYLKMEMIRDVCKRMKISLNDYLWSRTFNITDSSELKRHLRETQMEEAERNFWLPHNPNKDEDELIDRPPPDRPFSAYMKEAINKFVETLDVERKVIGRPSCSYERGNRDEYLDGEVIAHRKFVSVVTKPFVLRLQSALAFLESKQSSSTSEGNTEEPKEDGRSVNPQATIQKSPEKESAPKEYKTPKTFPDARSERIYHFVEEVLGYFWVRTEKFNSHRVSDVLYMYERKCNHVQQGLKENFLCIRDAISEEQRNHIETDVNILCHTAIQHMYSFRGCRSKCINLSNELGIIRNRLSEGYLDRASLARAKKTAKKLLSKMKETDEALYCSFDEVREVYGALMEFEDFLNKAREERVL